MDFAIRVQIYKEDFDLLIISDYLLTFSECSEISP